jgi:hypothetical protein
MTSITAYEHVESGELYSGVAANYSLLSTGSQSIVTDKDQVGDVTQELRYASPKWISSRTDPRLGWPTRNQPQDLGLQRHRNAQPTGSAPARLKVPNGNRAEVQVRAGSARAALSPSGAPECRGRLPTGVTTIGRLTRIGSGLLRAGGDRGHGRLPNGAWAAYALRPLGEMTRRPASECSRR